MTCAMDTALELFHWLMYANSSLVSMQPLHGFISAPVLCTQSLGQLAHVSVASHTVFPQPIEQLPMQHVPQSELA